LAFDESFPRIMHVVATDIEVLGETQASNKVGYSPFCLISLSSRRGSRLKLLVYLSSINERLSPYQSRTFASTTSRIQTRPSDTSTRPSIEDLFVSLFFPYSSSTSKLTK
jgi:hypothetical protein